MYINCGIDPIHPDILINYEEIKWSNHSVGQDGLVFNYYFSFKVEDQVCNDRAVSYPYGNVRRNERSNK